MFGCRPILAINIIFPTKVDHPRGMHSHYLENWKEVIDYVYATALQISACRKERDKKRKLQAGRCLHELEQGGKVLVRKLTPKGDLGKLRSYWEPEIAEVVSRYKKDVVYKIKSKPYRNRTKVLHRNMPMLVNHLLDTIDTVRSISPMKNKISPDIKNKTPKRKIKLHKQRAEDPRETTSSSEESDSEYELELAPNQLLHLRQTHTPKNSSKHKKHNFERHPKPDIVEPKMHSVPQDIANKRDSEHKINQQDQCVDFNLSELNEETSSDQFICNRRVKNFIRSTRSIVTSNISTKSKKHYSVIKW